VTLRDTRVGRTSGASATADQEERHSSRTGVKDQLGQLEGREAR
jgi:hypothetical protein